MFVKYFACVVSSEQNRSLNMILNSPSQAHLATVNKHQLLTIIQNLKVVSYTKVGLLRIRRCIPRQQSERVFLTLHFEVY